MKILTINIEMRPNANRRFLPIGLAYIHTHVVRAGYDADILDLDAHPQPQEVTKKFLKENRYDVVLMGCIVTGFDKIKWVSDAVREYHPKTVIIVGNTVASSTPETLLRHTSADVAVMGEGDVTILELLDCIKRGVDYSDVPGIRTLRDGRIKASPERPVIQEVDSIAMPDWGLWDTETYINSLSTNYNEPLPPIDPDTIRAMPLNTARGCPYTCTFCYHAFIGTKYRYRSAHSIVSEMRALNEQFGINVFAFNDELTFLTPKQTEAFADELIASGLKVWFEADCRSGLLKGDGHHLEIAHKLKQAGCLSLSFALESANPDILRHMDKKLGPDQFMGQARLLEKAGIATLTSVVFGYPTETPETIRQTIDVCIEAGVYPSAGFLLPQPGTPMYTYAVENGYIPDEFEYIMKIGDRQDLWLNMTKMSTEELQETVKKEMARCSRELGLGLDSGKLLKTGHYRSPDKKKKLALLESRVTCRQAH